jgi:uncharacterized membrane protein YfhO
MASIEATASSPAIVVVRNVYDKGWEATVDGRPGKVLPVDYLIQGIPIPAGTHHIVLRYRDDSVLLGLVVSASAAIIIAITVIAFWRRERKRTRTLSTVSS